ncbi:MAG: NAD(P)H-dependent oxidoreductase subunit E [Deltaproteobacteria bacterium]|nr:MAG: NAD(P)H-dependent oxidoreductase subunit E [Deltaproteobacteria bacterium]TMA54642.1 MAG: NAD(P)H-dependent oxidoreductase subunit E [Deltaproteobacteria bacterium]TMB24367.1 MAG: NAD(P)H-dependent oxidoreductase subunit E [Deltaproteobacteria bacterium]
MTTEGPRFSEGTLAEYRALLTRYPQRRAALMPTLWLAQREFGWLSLPVMEYVATLMELPLAWVTSVASFYTMYWKEPKGRWHIQLCRNLPCALRGAGAIQVAVERRLGIGDGERTADGRFSLEEVECLASCGTAPVLQVNNTEYHENLTVARALELIERLASP